MFLQRMQPTFPFADFGREMSRLMDTFGVNGGSSPRVRGFPALNVWEDSENLFVEAELPGLTMNDIELTVVGDELSIKGQRRFTGADDVIFHRRERGVGEFSRFVTLPFAVYADNVEAVLRDGVLIVTLPKAAEAKPRRIQVKAN